MRSQVINHQFGDSVARRAVFDHLVAFGSPATDCAIAAQLDLDLRRVQTALAGLVLEGLVIEQGQLYVVPRLAA